MELNENMSFREVVSILKEFKEQHKEKVRSFSYYELHEKVLYIRSIRDTIYKMGFEEWKKDKIWEYMNDYEFLYVLKNIANRQKNK